MALLLIATFVQLFAVVPYDVMSRTQTVSSELKDIFDIVIRVCYWTITGVSWIVMPLIVCACLYRNSLTKARAYWHMIKDNFVWYILAALFCVACLITMYFTAEFSLENIEPLCMAMTNACGLVIMIFFLGHGLVELPRQIFTRADPKRRLRAMLSTLHAAAEEAAQATVNSTCAAEGCIQLRDTMDKELEPLLLGPLERRQNALARTSRVRVLPEYCYDMKGPSMGYSGMPRQNFRRSTVGEIEEFLFMCDECVNVADEFNFQIDSAVVELETVMNEVIAYSKHEASAILRKVAWIMFGVLIIVLNCVVCWSELAFVIGLVEYGPFYLISECDIHPMVILSVITPLIVAYVTVVTGWSVSKVRLSKTFDRFAPCRTSEAAMYFWVCAIARVSCTFAYHYMLQLNATDTETYRLYVRMKDVLFLGNDIYNTYMPGCMFVMMILFAFRVWDKLLDAIGVQKFHFHTDEPPIKEVGRGLEIVRSMRPDLAQVFDAEPIRVIGGDAPMLSTFSTNFPSYGGRYTK